MNHAQPNEALPDLDALWDYNDPQASERRFMDLIPAAERSGDRNYHVELLTQLARTQSLQRKFDAAHAILDRAEKLLDDTTPRGRVRYLLERGRTHNSADQREVAKSLFLDTWNVAALHVLEDLALDAVHMIAIAETDPLRQAEWNRTGIQLAENSVDPKTRAWLGPLYNNLGWTLFDRREYEAALDLFRKALLVRQARKQGRETRIARWCVAKTLRVLGRVEEALEIQRDLLEQAGPNASGEEGYTHEEIGECLLALGRPDEARPYFAQAHERLSQIDWLVESAPERIQRLKELSED